MTSHIFVVLCKIMLYTVYGYVHDCMCSLFYLLQELERRRRAVDVRTKKGSVTHTPGTNISGLVSCTPNKVWQWSLPDPARLTGPLRNVYHVVLSMRSMARGCRGARSRFARSVARCN